MRAALTGCTCPSGGACSTCPWHGIPVELPSDSDASVLGRALSTMTCEDDPDESTEPTEGDTSTDANA